MSNLLWYLKKNYFDDFHVIDPNQLIDFNSNASIKDIKVKVSSEDTSLKLLVFKSVSYSQTETTTSSRVTYGFQRFSDATTFNLSSLSSPYYKFGSLNLNLCIANDTGSLGLEGYYKELMDFKLESQLKNKFGSYLILNISNILD